MYVLKTIYYVQMEMLDDWPLYNILWRYKETGLNY